MAFLDSQVESTIYYGEAPAQVLLAGTATKGDALGYSGGWKRALGTAGGVIQIRCVAGESGVSGQTIVVYFGTCKLGGGRFSGATAGGAVYVAEGTSNGMYTQTIPSTSTDATTTVGYAINATDLMITPQHPADTVA